MNGMMTGMVSGIFRGIARTLNPREKQEIKPTTEKTRHRCPFYGFSAGPGILMDQEGNQCALITGSYSPCQMEYQNLPPEWDNCSFNNEKTKETIEKTLASFRVFPKEFWPENKTSWDGISFKEWQGYITSR